MPKWLKQLFCKHDIQPCKKYGFGTIYYCTKCGKKFSFKYMDKLWEKLYRTNEPFDETNWKPFTKE